MKSLLRVKQAFLSGTHHTMSEERGLISQHPGNRGIPG